MEYDMKLDSNYISEKAEWTAAGVELPDYDRQTVSEKTRSHPVWIHFGAGNIFRGFPAAVQQTLLNKGISDTGIIVAEGFDYEIIEKAYRPYDNLCLLVVLKSDGTIEKKVIGSVTESLVADSSGPDWARLLSVFAEKSLQMASFTITEKGYNLVDDHGGFIPAVEKDIKNGYELPVSIIGKVAALCYERFRKGAFPLALVSMDNCSHNGTKLHDAVCAIAGKWRDTGFVGDDFLSYLEDKKKISFPWSMIDKITPRPDVSVKTMLEKDGFESTDIIITSKNTYTAPFVNAEEAEYLIIEDSFPNGRPRLEEGGIIFSDRNTVDRVEKMKVCTCLNPLHTALAIFGNLLSYTSIHKEMHDPQLKKLVEKIGYDEGLPVVVNPGIIDPRVFIKEVIDIRLPNPFMPDTPQRIASDSSLKIPIRFGETIKAYIAHSELKAENLVYIPLVFAGWCRYLMGIDDNGNSFEPSPDPRLESARIHVSDILLGDGGSHHSRLEPLLSDATIFGVNLYDAGLGQRVEGYFSELTAGKGAVRKTLVKYLR